MLGLKTGSIAPRAADERLVHFESIKKKKSVPKAYV